MARFRLGYEGLPTPVPPVQTSEDLVDAVGVNVHLTYGNTPYEDTQAVIGALDYLGVSSIRDYAPDVSNPHPAYDAVASAGFRFDLFVQDTPARIDAIERLERNHRGAVRAIEGPNEINNFPVHFAGRSGRAAADLLQKALFLEARRRPLLADKPVYMFTGYPPGRFADAANVHEYSHRGDNPIETLLVAVMQNTRGQFHRPFIVSETGYFTAAQPVGWGGVTPLEQAQMELEGLLDAVKLGARAVYVYELLDGVDDRGPPDQEHHFGLFDRAYRPKPAAVAMHNFLQDLRVRHDRSQCPRPDITTISGAASWLVLMDPGGHTRLIVWRGPRDLERRNRLEIRFEGRPVKLQRQHPLLQAGPDGPTEVTTRTQVPVRNGPVILEIGC